MSLKSAAATFFILLCLYFRPVCVNNRATVYVIVCDYVCICVCTRVRACVCRFRLVPFLVELRAVMDWVWTDTTLSLSNWMCVEDIYANIFIIKCSRETEKVGSRTAASDSGARLETLLDST